MSDPTKPTSKKYIKKNNISKASGGKLFYSKKQKSQKRNSKRKLRKGKSQTKILKPKMCKKGGVWPFGKNDDKKNDDKVITYRVRFTKGNPILNGNGLKIIDEGEKNREPLKDVEYLRESPEGTVLVEKIDLDIKNARDSTELDIRKLRDSAGGTVLVEGTITIQDVNKIRDSVKRNIVNVKKEELEKKSKKFEKLLRENLEKIQKLNGKDLVEGLIHVKKSLEENSEKRNVKEIEESKMAVELLEENFKGKIQEVEESPEENSGKRNDEKIENAVKLLKETVEIRKQFIEVKEQLEETDAEKEELNNTIDLQEADAKLKKPISWFTNENENEIKRIRLTRDLSILRLIKGMIIKLRDLELSKEKLLKLELSNDDLEKVKSLEEKLPKLLFPSLEILLNPEFLLKQYSEQNSTDSEQNSTDSEQNSTDSEQNPTDSEQNPTDSEQNPTDSEQKYYEILKIKKNIRILNLDILVILRIIQSLDAELIEVIVNQRRAQLPTPKRI